MFTAPLLINGIQTNAEATFVRRSPVNNEIATTAAAASLSDVDTAIAAASQAFPAWAAMPPAQRRSLLLKAADLLDSRTPDFIALGVAEAGGKPMWYGFNAMLAGNILREAASMVTQICGEIIPSNVPGNMAMGVRQACGVVVGIAPWNAPVILGVRAIAMPLACGNTVILKSSELCPALHLLIGEVLNDAGFPPGVVNVISNAPEDAAAIVERLIAAPSVKRINFTGSTRVGKVVAALGAKYLKPVLLELGGKNPLVILDDANLEEAVNAAVFGSFFNQGQICMSTERIIVQEKIADDFVAAFAKRTAAIRAGLPQDEQSQLGLLIDASAGDRAKALAADAVQQGGKLVTGPLACENTLMQPAIVDGVTSSMRIYHDESFAPIVGIVRVKSDEEAIACANDTEYGLSAAVFSQDVSRAMNIARQIESGICHINGPTVHDEAQMPFGGVKSSGYGRFGGKAAINEFTDLRWITLQSGSRHYPI
ncbi:aldehyde dehydrogenase [Leeia oryzae]|uniref:aldehyde dehydrogenase n=1 Tax=Leeia oryzae TaxID=356662 RepID=UPI000370D501|nr:aldehyde dehydrogenase [Leeia oryzae]